MATFVAFDKDGTRSYGRLEESVIFELEAPPWISDKPTGRKFPLREMKLLCPVAPSKIILTGLNYKDHAKESASATKEFDEPVLALKAPSALIGPEEPIVHPGGGLEVHFEGELALVIGKKARKVFKEEAPKYVLGYTCLNDVTARNLQKKDVQWSRAKSFDTFCPVGPWIVTGLDPAKLNLTTRQNGLVRQKGETARMVWNPFELVSFISSVMTLLPGDVISTGTPAGVGSVLPEDVIEIEIEGIGVLRNRVAAG
ncbi:MAG: fumarylacetoacetate hydrolase family protein [candidate division Zixibacteria bacterium]|nr:fumarylacetoacetate hydrolase family protein [candidate division Zixibacteria bacterium]